MYCVLCGKEFDKNELVCGGQHNGQAMCDIGSIKPEKPSSSEDMKMFINNCYDCKNSREVPGNAHIKCVKPDADMRGNQRGISRGWFMYPLLFDPVWIEKKCSNFESVAVSGPVSLVGKSI